ncbi:MAG TPA: hypothetical protein VIL63_14685, partial [Terriglobales bacterium]
MPTIEMTMTKSAPQTSLRVELREYPRAPKRFAQHTNINIREGEVHIWYAAPSLPFGDVDRVAILSKDEHARMARFRFDGDQKNFLFCRSMLRMLL